MPHHQRQLLPTIGTIAERCNESVHRVRYVLETRGIEPSGRAGNARVFTDADVDRVRAELARIDRGKNGKNG